MTAASHPRPLRIPAPSWTRRGAGVLLLCALLHACGDSGEGETSGPPPEAAAKSADHNSVLQTISELGYVDYSDQTAAGPGGVVLLDQEAAYPGYSLYTSIPHGIAELIDLNGEVVHAWHIEPDRPARAAPPIPDRLNNNRAAAIMAFQDSKVTRCELLQNGDVVVIGYDPEPYLGRYSWEGEALWKQRIPVHHDVEERTNGDLVALTEYTRLVPEVDPDIPIKDNFLTVVSADGEILEERSVYDMLAARETLFGEETGAFLEGGKWKSPNDTTSIDLLHLNAVHWLRRGDLAEKDERYSLDHVLVCSRRLDALFLLDWSENRCIWAWGVGELQKPHEGMVRENGNIVLLDNGLFSRGYSRVVEVDPRTDTIAWEFTAPEPSDFYTPGRGTTQPLPNGNVLVGNSNSGEAFEVTQDGRMVWRFLNPHTDENGRRGVLRIHRYEKDLVEGVLAGK